MANTPQSKGGIARAENLSSQERSEIASAAAKARWASIGDISKLPQATHDGVLHIGTIEIPCAVLSDGTRLLTQRGVYGAIGRSGGTGSLQGHAQQLPRFLAPANLKRFISKELECAAKPIAFRPKKGAVAYGYKADLLIDICHVYLDAHDAGALKPQQAEIARRCKILDRGLGKTGIIGLVDEATGYQEVREKDALQQILSAYISAELLPWSRKFPEEFHREMFRLWGWKWPPAAGARGPRYAGKLTNKVIYDKLPAGVRQELEALNPADENWQRRNRHHQHLTEGIGQPHLEKQVAVATNIMKVCDDKEEFMEKFERAFPGTFSRGRQLNFIRSLEKQTDD